MATEQNNNDARREAAAWNWTIHQLCNEVRDTIDDARVLGPWITDETAERLATEMRERILQMLKP